ncbi:hypothetical protein Neosp_007201 [[Neocosmospora] mangrovei]
MVSRLQVENELLEEELQHIKTAPHTSPEDVKEEVIHEETGSHRCHGPTKFAMLYRVNYEDRLRGAVVRFYLDPPRLFKGDTENSYFRGTIEILDEYGYLGDHPEVAFAVVKHYFFSKEDVREVLVKEGQTRRLGQVLRQDHYLEEPEESQIILGVTTQDGIKAILEAFPGQFPGFQNPPDFLGWEDADSVDDRFEVISEPYTFFHLFGKTIIEALGEVEMGDLMRESLRLLCQWMEDNYREEWDEAEALFAQGKVNSNCLQELFRPGELVFCPGSNGPESGGIVPWFPDTDTRTGRRFCSWEFNGHLAPHWQEPMIPLPPSSAERRFMIDYGMYRRLHPTNSLFRMPPGMVTVHDRLLKIEEPPEDFLYCLPPVIHGFDFTTKTWKTLQVDRITDVTWNKKAFSQLVAPPETKELIQAVVSAHGERKNMGLDIIEGKGQGLLVLLHGGPGTGKTLTAESIAEEQERPLYRVTCGDIGTEPKEVEQYLGDVLEIGRAWGCVVLLDEADVFLEERSFSDQKRNAIISIFLRILEYYDGILILTTNRIGSFDEAFKSRIQLALGYPTLDEEDRLKIWGNFVQMLPRTKDRVDMEDLRMNLPKLARVEINGREIRNIITMARHLAKFRKETLRYQHMRDALRSSQKFSEYLNQVKGVSDDDWARADKLR